MFVEPIFAKARTGLRKANTFREIFSFFKPASSGQNIGFFERVPTVKPLQTLGFLWRLKPQISGGMYTFLTPFTAKPSAKTLAFLTRFTNAEPSRAPGPGSL